MNLATIISYCGNDERFIRRCIDNALKVSDQVIVPISDHLFDGTPEDIESIKVLAKDYPTVDFTLFEWTAGKHPRYWHNMSRHIGYTLLNEEIDWVLYLDSDEILDADQFSKFTKEQTFDLYDSYKLGCYWYFREEQYRATTYEDSPVLIRKEFININIHNLYAEREQLHEALNVRKRRMVLVDNKPIIHHYSWVRTKEQMLQKVKAWGHNADKDWVSLIEEEFARPFNGKCFVNDYIFTILDK